jgi:hypothetical protein
MIRALVRALCPEDHGDEPDREYADHVHDNHEAVTALARNRWAASGDIGPFTKRDITACIGLETGRDLPGEQLRRRHLEGVCDELGIAREGTNGAMRDAIARELGMERGDDRPFRRDELLEVMWAVLR